MTTTTFVGDDFGIALAAGARQALRHQALLELKQPPFTWNSSRYHGLAGAAETRGKYLHVALEDLAGLFGAVLLQGVAGAPGGVGTLQLEDGRVVEFARGTVGCLVDGRVTAMWTEAVERDGRLCITSSGLPRASSTFV